MLGLATMRSDSSALATPGPVEVALIWHEANGRSQLADWRQAQVLRLGSHRTNNSLNTPRGSSANGRNQAALKKNSNR